MKKDKREREKKREEGTGGIKWEKKEKEIWKQRKNRNRKGGDKDDN